MTNDRRDFLRRIVAGAFASASVPAVAAPIQASVTKTWRWFRVSNIRESQEDQTLVMNLIAQRSDGHHFYVCVPMHKDHFTPAHVSADFMNALDTLETFRDCACGPDSQCDVHRAWFPPSDEWVRDEDDE